METRQYHTIVFANTHYPVFLSSRKNPNFVQQVSLLACQWQAHTARTTQAAGSLDSLIAMSTRIRDE